MQQVRAKKQSCEYTVRAKKFLGQHFLTDLKVAQRIAETLLSGRTIEIGPGMGVLTQVREWVYLLNICSKTRKSGLRR